MGNTGGFFVLLSISFAAICGYGAARAETIHINPKETGAPISPYVYGQFIEHLGRCIYGGIWAEMLEDRKFFYPVDGRQSGWDMHAGRDVSWEGHGIPYEILKASPWQILGPLDAVTMNTTEPFVGDHEPVITLDASEELRGIYHPRLTLEAERAYTGYVIVKAVGDVNRMKQRFSGATQGRMKRLPCSMRQAARSKNTPLF